MNKPEAQPVEQIKKCGIVMPISSSDGCSEAHWSDVLEIITEAVDSAGYEANLVSNADEVGIIQKRIIQNLYSNPIIVCDVSSKNPNVMLELGMRLAFDRPVVIIKDDKTAYSFDTSPIEHLTYPRDLRFSKIVEFKAALTSKIQKTVEAAEKDPDFSPFLKHFGAFTVAKIDTKEVSSDEYIIDELRSMRRQLSRLTNRSRASFPSSEDNDFDFDICVRGEGAKPDDKVAHAILAIDGVNMLRFEERGDDHFHAFVSTDSTVSPSDFNEVIDKHLVNAKIRTRRSNKS